MGTSGTSWEPFPDKILDDVGGTFELGAMGGSAFHFVKGLYNSPNGEQHGGTQAIRMNVPRVGGSFTVWGGLFSAFDCTMVYLRQKEDPWNSIVADAATGGFLQTRQGLGAASRTVVFGGVLLPLIEGAGIMLNMILSVPQNMPPMGMENVGMPQGYVPQVGVSVPTPVAESAASFSLSSWFGGVFGGGKKESARNEVGGGSKTKVLKNFDSQSPPVPSFEFK